MKKFTILSIAALAVVACSEGTNPTGTNQVVSASPNSIISSTGVIDFESDFGAAASFSPNRIAEFPNSDNFTYASGGQRFLGRFGSETAPYGPSDAVEFAAGPGNNFTLQFNLYIIGSWDGAGKLRKFGVDQWQIGYYCGSNSTSIQNLFTTDFSNQKNEPQHYPNTVDGPTNPAMAGAISTNSLGYFGTDITEYHNGDASGASAVYQINQTFSTSCSGQSVTFVFQTPRGLQQLSDESWGIDNFQLTVNS